MKNIYETIIIGGGPAGVAAGVYAARKKMKALLITDTFGGQSMVSDSIENWIGETSISGFELAKKLEKHVRSYKELAIATGEKVKLVEEAPCGFKVISDKNEYLSASLIVVSGGRHRTLNIPGEKEFTGKGVAYCATCDAPFYKNKKVAVVGGGNSGLEAVIDLAPYATEIYLILNTDKPTGDPTTIEQVNKLSQVKIIKCKKVNTITGTTTVTGIKYTDAKNNKEIELAVDGVFVEIGSVPNTEFIGDLVKKNKAGEIVVDYKRGVTSNPGIFAAGDVTDDVYQQNNIAVGDAIRSTLSAYYYVLDIRKRSKAEDCELTKGYRVKS